MVVSLRNNTNSQMQSTKGLDQSENTLTDFSNLISENALDMLAYHQITPLMMVDEQECGINIPANTHASKAYQINYKQLAIAYYKNCFPNLHPLFCSLKKCENIEDVLEQSEPLTLHSKFAAKQDTLLIPAFSPLGCVGVFTINIERAHAKLSSLIDRAELIAQVLMQAQACHVKICRTQAQQNTAAAKLTERERQILCWVTRGKSNSVIAEILGISVHTVTGYLRNIYLKTQTNDRTSAAIFAIQLGILHKVPDNGVKLEIAV